MEITKATTSDAHILTELTLASKAYWNYSPELIETWRNDLTITPAYIEKHTLYKLTNQETTIGFYAYEQENKTDLKLEFLFVDPAYIGKGYGKALIQHFFKKAVDGGFKKVTLDADPNAEQFYLSQGFKVIGQLPSTVKNRFLPIMEKAL